MKVPEEGLRRLKQSTAEALKKAEAAGDPVAIERARANDELAADLIKRNGNGKLTAGDIIRLSYLVERIVEWLSGIDWFDFL